MGDAITGLAAVAALAVGIGVGVGWAKGWRRTAFLAGLVMLCGIGALHGLQTRTFSSCVVAGAIVATPSGPRPIEALRVGDEVIGLEGDGAKVVGTVTAKRTALAEEYLLITLESGRSLKATGAHPIACNGRWMRASSAQPGDQVQTLEGPSRVTRIERRAERVTVCDLQVDACSNFFADGILVHNKRMTARTLFEAPKPQAIVGVWVGWDTRRESPFCRLELDADRTGRCALWHDLGYGDEVYFYRVSRWELVGDRLSVALRREGSEDTEHMRGQVFRGMLSLKYFGSDGPRYFSPWFGPLRLVPEDTAQRAADATKEAISGAR